MPDEATGWRRLSSRMLLIHPVRELIRLLPALIGIVFAGRHAGGEWWGLAGAVLVLAIGVARWFTTSYRITPERVELKTGLLQRNTLSTPLDRVRSVDVTATLLHRGLGLAVVKIGTGAGEKQLSLDGLPAGQATALRAELLHRMPAAASAPTVTTAPDASAGPAAGAAVPPFAEPPGATSPGTQQPGIRQPDLPAYVQAETDDVVYQLNPGWARYAPFGPSGLIAALAFFAVGLQVLNQIGLDPTSSAARSIGGWAQQLGGVALVIIGVVVMLAFVSVLAVIGYLLNYYGFRLSRNVAGGSFHVTRGLLTTRATSLDLNRLRGVEVHEQVPMRWVHGAHLRAITTGVKDEGSQHSSMLAPPSPVGVVRSVADQVLDAPGVAETTLTTHGPVATRRRYTRSMIPSGIVAVVVLWLFIAQWHHVVVGVVIAALVMIAAGYLGWSRARALGHVLDRDYLITRSGSLDQVTAIVESDAAVVVTHRQTFFQRRAGVATVEIATAAGKQSYAVTDLPADHAPQLAEDLLARARS